MGKIKKLPEALANQIAAGEVVERPASVVKELVENAIDAGSTDITVELIEAGIQQIKVIDNGEGMDEADLKMAFVPHATSKIYHLHDLFHIHSLGFRGEALASIGSVAKVRVESMQHNAPQGHFVEIEGSTIKNLGVANARPGTTINVTGLFYNTPARLKHLKTIRTEIKHSLNFIQEIALSHPEIRFTLRHDNQKIFSSFGSGELRQTIANIYQPSVARQLIEIREQDDDFELTGFISPPTLTRTSKYNIHWIINGRTIRSYVLNDILIKAYGRQLMIGRYPLAVLRIELDPRLVDVNVHPTKQTVRLSKEDELATLIKRAVENMLRTVNPVPEVETDDILNKRPFHMNENLDNGGTSHTQTPSQLPFEFEYRAQYSDEKRSSHSIDDAANSAVQLNEQNTDSENETATASHNQAHHQQPSHNHVYNSTDRNTPHHSTTDILQSEKYVVEESLLPFPEVDTTLMISDPEKNVLKPSREIDERDDKTAQHKTTEQHNVTNLSHTAKVNFLSLRYVGQIHGTYLIAESEHGFYLIDQHAAQEKIRYETFMKYNPEVYHQQQLLFPYIFEFSASEKMQIEDILPKLETMGIFLTAFGPTSYQLEAYPNWLDEEEVEKTVRDLTHLIGEQPNLTIAELKEKSLIMKSCRGAIKANHYLSPKEATYLIQQMATLDDPYHCPHGRPVFIEFNDKTLEKLFKRIQDPHERGTNR